MTSTRSKATQHQDSCFFATVQVAAGTPAGTVRVRDDREYLATHMFDSGQQRQSSLMPTTMDGLVGLGGPLQHRDLTGHGLAL